MVGKIIKENDMVIVLSPYGNFILENNNPFYESVTEKINHNIPVWVEFDIENEVVCVDVLYDYTFGTHHEGISIATSRYEKNRYPIGGFSPGYNMLVCGTCQIDFVGAKHSTQCEICGIQDVINYVETKNENDLKLILDGLIEYYSKLLKITRDPNYRGAVDQELKRVSQDIKITKNKIK